MGAHLVLPHRHTVVLSPTKPFNFDASLHKPDHFPSSDNAWVPGIRWQTMLWQGKRLGLKFKNQGTVGRPRILLSIWTQERLSKRYLDGLLDEINYRYSFLLDLSDFNRRFRDDPQFGPILRKWHGMRDLSFSSLYEFLIIAIVLQNCTVRRSVKMMQALFEKYGTCLMYDGREFYCFWKPEEMASASEEELRALKVGYRSKSILRVTAAFRSGQIDEFELRNKPVEVLRSVLLTLYGVGPASVGYILSAVFHHLDEMNHISPWEQKIYSKLFFGRDPEKPVAVDKLIMLFNRRFKGYRALAVHYIWEDLFWKRTHEPVEWLETLIRL